MTTTTEERLACPNCREKVEVREEQAICSACGPVGRLVNNVWDFVAEETYAETFGRQWTRFPETQLDSRNGTTISRDQFLSVTGWTKEDLEGKTVLDGGCGSGRYAEIAFGLGAHVTGLDLSQAAYVCRRNFPEEQNLTVVRGNLLSPPLQAGTFDRVFSMGVVQSTPDPLEVARQLARLVRPGGKLAIWMYTRTWYTPFLVRTLLWRVTRHLPPPVILRLCDVLVSLFTPIAKRAGNLKDPRLRKLVRGVLPIVSYWGELPLSETQQREWSFLDTHDWLSPTYNIPQTFETMKETLEAEGLANVWRVPTPGLGIIASRPDGQAQNPRSLAD